MSETPPSNWDRRYLITVSLTVAGLMAFNQILNTRTMQDYGVGGIYTSNLTIAAIRIIITIIASFFWSFYFMGPLALRVGRRIRNRREVRYQEVVLLVISAIILVIINFGFLALAR